MITSPDWLAQVAPQRNHAPVLLPGRHLDRCRHRVAWVDGLEESQALAQVDRARTRQPGPERCGDDAGDQQAVCDGTAEPAAAGKLRIEVQGIAISREIGEPLDVRLRDRLRERGTLSRPRDHTPVFASEAAGPPSSIAVSARRLQGQAT